MLLRKHWSLPVSNPESLQDHSRRIFNLNSCPKRWIFGGNLQPQQHTCPGRVGFFGPNPSLSCNLPFKPSQGFQWLLLTEHPMICLPAIIAIKLSPTVFSACPWLPFPACLLFTVGIPTNPTGIAVSSATEHVKVRGFC